MKINPTTNTTDRQGFRNARTRLNKVIDRELSRHIEDARRDCVRQVSGYRSVFRVS